jgi:hypothetical protein
MAKSIRVYGVLGAFAAIDNPHIKFFPIWVSLKDIYPSPIDYRNNNLINKPTIPTLPAEITDAQVTSGVGTDEVLMTPMKLKTAIVAHAPVAVLGTFVTGALTIVTSSNLPPGLKKEVSIYRGTDEVVAEV